MTIGRIVKLLRISAKIDLVWLLRDTKYAVAVIIADVISNISMAAGVFLIAVRFDGIGGMTSDEVLFMMAYSTLITGIFQVFGAGNNIHISRIIGRGQLEHHFIQPLPLPVQLCTQGFMPFTASANLFVGVALMVTAVRRMSLAITPFWLVQLVVYLLTSLSILITRSYMASSLTFYAPVACEEISTTVIDDPWLLSTFPLSGMPRFIQIPLITILPEGLLAWFPALVLLGKPPFAPYYPMLYALLTACLAAYLFRRGFLYYLQKGSNRYVPYGFRR